MRSREAMTVQEAIRDADGVLPGKAAPEEAEDPRWQAIIAVRDFVESEPDAVWHFIRRWGVHADADLRAAIATCLLEHLLERHFETFFPRSGAGSCEPVVCWDVQIVFEVRAVGGTQ